MKKYHIPAGTSVELFNESEINDVFTLQKNVHEFVKALLTIKTEMRLTERAVTFDESEVHEGTAASDNTMYWFRFPTFQSKNPDGVLREWNLLTVKAEKVQIMEEAEHRNYYFGPLPRIEN